MSQNSATITPARHNRVSAHKSFMSSSEERRGLRSILRDGRRLRRRRYCFAHEPAGHGEHHHQAAEQKRCGRLERRSPPAIAPSKIAMKVAPSTSALPVGISSKDR